MGVFCSALIESMLYCGVCAATRIGDAHLGIEPEVRLHRGAGAQRDVKTVRHVLLGQAELRSPHAVDIQMKVGRVDDLMHVDIDRAGNSGYAFAKAAGDLVVAGIVALYLHVNGRGQPEVEDLRHHVGWLEEEGEVGKLLLQLLPHLLHVLFGGTMMLRVECDQHLAIGAADGRAIAEGVVEGLRCKSDVVHNQIDLVDRNDLANLVFDFAELNFGSLDARAGLCPDMQLDLTGVDRGEEVPADKRQQQECRGHDRNRCNQRRLAMMQHSAERIGIPLLHPEVALVEAIVDSAEDGAFRRYAGIEVRRAFEAMLGAQHEFTSTGTSVRESTYDASMANTTASAHRGEEELRRSGEEDHRDEDDTDSERRDQGRRRDLGGTDEHASRSGCECMWR